ncbi:MAG: SsrA-binding protein SmpB [Dehalococcoidia bacterium]
MAQATKQRMDATITVNRKAGHDYELLDRFEAGIALTGTEIKSIREGRINLREAYIRIQNGEALLLNCHIAQYQPGSYQNHEPTRPRTLLLHKNQIRQLAEATNQKGLTIVPTRMYYSRGRAKVEVAVARGRKSYDKRAAIADRDAQRQMARALRHSA